MITYRLIIKKIIYNNDNKHELNNNINIFKILISLSSIIISLLTLINNPINVLL